MIKKILIAASIGLLFSAAQANEVLTKYPNGNVEAGQKLFVSKNTGGAFESCVSCHSDNLKGNGKHAKTGREIKPLAPIANPDRFTDLAKVEKWFKRNCNDVISRECSAKEKADVIAYLRSIK
jgi:mono/diheme cytochrome c family protein